MTFYSAKGQEQTAYGFFMFYGFLLGNVWIIVILYLVERLPKFMWILSPGKRNEALDCAVYALGAFVLLSPPLDVLASENLIYSGKPLKRTVRKRRVLNKGVS